MATGNGEESRQEIGLMSRKCRNFSADLSAYFDGELEGKPLHLLESHLQDCDGCRGDLEKMGRIRSALFSLTGSPAEREPLVHRIMEKIRQDSDEDDLTPS
ncbi:MAG: zf-HC2 domain-containing protein [SAR324 cluster bacterium]|nr:zf-HC2 domain-containing protein [SAR324 cluster bacterium]